MNLPLYPTRSWLGSLTAAGLVAMAVALVPWAASAQTPQGYQPPPQKAPAKSQPKRQAEQPAATGSEAGLRQRVEQLEEQLVDLQVHLGTVESMSRGGTAASSSAYRGGPSPMSGGSGADTGRIAALETQVQALSAQIEQMAAQMRAMQGGGAVAAPRGPAGPAPRSSGGGFGQATVVPPDDPIASIINNPDPRTAAPPSPQQRVASGPQLNPSSGGSRQLYDQAYTQLLQQNYEGAQNSFQEFLQRFPNDDLTPNAQFWLGETHFVRGGWDAAAAAFLKVAQTFPRAEKAPDSLAKFAMAMERKGNRPAACRALGELRTRYPNPPAHVRAWEAAERRRANCN